MENIEYAEHMMKMYKQEIVECKRKGNLHKQLKANGKYYAYRDMMHYMKEREQKKPETTAPELYQHIMQWVACSERLPNEHQDVMVYYYSNKNSKHFPEQQFMKESSFYDNRFECDEEVTHWAELPEPPCA